MAMHGRSSVTASSTIRGLTGRRASFRPGQEVPLTRGSLARVPDDRSWDPWKHSGVQPLELLSLDIFDTLVVRRCGAPRNLFLMLGRRLDQLGLVEQSAESFATIRYQAEQTVWRREGGLDSHTDLTMIYEEVRRRLSGSGHDEHKLADMEFELELELLVATPWARQLAASGRPDRTVFTSDTYFSAEQISTILSKCAISHTPDQLFVSSERAASKATGALYEDVLQTFGADPRTVLHIGDHPYSDVDVPRSLGMHAIWQADARETRFERRLSESSHGTGALSASLSGAARSARLEVPAPTPHERTLRDVAAGVAAPALVGFVLWLLQRASDEGRQRLYFLSRDGQILLKVAEALAPALDLDLELRYLRVSRQTTNLAATFEIVPEQIDWVFRDAPELTIGELLERFDLRWDEAEPFLTDDVAAVGPSGPAQACSIALRQLLLEGPEPLRELLRERASTRRQVVSTYLEQEGFGDGVPFGIVDFGGVGSQIRSIFDLARDLGAPEPTAYLVGLDDPRDAGLHVENESPPWLGATRTWLYDHRRNLGWRRQRGFGTLFQVFCACDHGTVVGYEPKADEIAAVLSCEQDPALLSWGLPVMQGSIEAVAGSMLLTDDLVDRGADLREVVIDLIDDLWRHPSRAEAQSWGAFPIEGAGAVGERAVPLAHPYTIPEIVGGVAHGLFPDLGWRHWFEASVVRSRAWVRVPLGYSFRVYTRAIRSRHPIVRSATGALRASRRQRRAR